MDSIDRVPEYHIDASSFQKPLVQLAEVLAQKVRREAPKLLAAPDFVSVDLHVLIRQAMSTYDLLFYVNADERRDGDAYWRPVYQEAMDDLTAAMRSNLSSAENIFNIDGTNPERTSKPCIWNLTDLDTLVFCPSDNVIIFRPSNWNDG